MDVDYDKINNVDFTVYNEVKEYMNQIDTFTSPQIHLQYDLEDEPILDIITTDEYQENKYSIGSYEHPDFNREEFGIFYNLWIMTFEEEIEKMLGNVTYDELE